MKIIILLATTLALALAETPPTSDPQPQKPPQKAPHPVPVISAKTQAPYYVPQHSPPYLQYVQKSPILIPQPQPHTTMLIIAQPALIPQHMLYGHAAQQLLHYFHTNPQAKLQFLNGFHPHPTAQTYLQVANYPVLQQQQPYQQSTYQQGAYQVPTAQTYQQSTYQQPPTHQLPQIYQTQQQAAPSPSSSAGYHQGANPSLQQIAQYASLSAQQYSAPIKTAPPIITGFENFTPEQQAQIKEQLSNHFGGSLSPINANSVQASAQFGAKYGTSGAEEGAKSDGVYGAKQYAKA